MSAAMGRRMNGGRKFTRAGGALLAAAILVGAVAGVILRQPSLGIVAGFGVGLVLLVAVWLLDRR